MKSELPKVAAKKKSELTSVSFTKNDGKDLKQKIQVRVEEIKNGFLIIKTTDGQNAEGNWEYIEEKTFSKNNPLAIRTDDKSLAELFE